MTPIHQPPDGQAHEDVENGEGEAHEEADLGVGYVQVALHRLDQKAQYLAINERERVGEDKDRDHVPGVNPARIGCRGRVVLLWMVQRFLDL